MAQVSWCFKNSSQPVGSIGKVVPLAAECSVELPDPGRIEDSLIDLYDVIIKAAPQTLQAPLHEVAVLRWQIDTIKKVGAIAGVCEDWIRPAIGA